jgi:hypothetical protein
MKISLRTLLLGVAFAGLMLAALVQPSLFWMRVMFSLAVCFLLFAIMGALKAPAKGRTFWSGVAVFGIGYFVLLVDGRLIDSPQQGTMLPRLLITQQLLDGLADLRGLPLRSQFQQFKLWDDFIFENPPPPSTWNSASSSSGSKGGPPPGMGSRIKGGSSFGGSKGGPPPGSSGMGSGSMPGGSGSGGGMAPAAFTNANYNQFLIAGHSCFLVLFGLAGGAASLWAFGREDEGPATATQRAG